MNRFPAVRWISITILLAATVTLLLTRFGNAAAAERVVAEALEPGSWSVLFSVQPNLTLGSYSGSTLSLKRHLAGGRALRIGVSLDLGGSNDDFADAAGDSSNSLWRTGTSNRSHQSIGVGTHYLWYTRRAAPVHGYWGVGPAVSWSRSHSERSQTEVVTFTAQPAQTRVVVEDFTSRGWRVGVAGTAGVEWLVARRIGLFAEYGTALNYSSSSAIRRSTITWPAQPTRTDDSDRRVHGWDVSGSGGRLGVSVYY